MKPTVHIVSFNVPYPPDYGGVMDVFYKITALKRLGVDVILHCFCYGRPHSRTLEDICRKVYYYRRNLNVFFLLKPTPFIVLSRKNPELLKNLCKDDYPIILEGLHCTAFLGDDLLKDRFIMVRTHNIEHLYYRQLAEVEKNIFRRTFFRRESGNLRNMSRFLTSLLSYWQFHRVIIYILISALEKVFLWARFILQMSVLHFRGKVPIYFFTEIFPLPRITLQHFFFFEMLYRNGTTILSLQVKGLQEKFGKRLADSEM